MINIQRVHCVVALRHRFRCSAALSVRHDAACGQTRRAAATPAPARFCDAVGVCSRNAAGDA